MDDWEQPHNNATLLKPAKHCHSVLRALQGHEKPSGKADLAIYGHSIVVSGSRGHNNPKILNAFYEIHQEFHVNI